jgi:Mg-chelatase subunit ChlD
MPGIVEFVQKQPVAEVPPRIATGSKALDDRFAQGMQPGQVAQVPERPPERSCEVLFVLDCSGSMDSHAVEAVRGFNRFVREQKGAAQPDATMALTLFSDDVRPVYPAQPLAGVRRMRAADFDPDGSTALLDALGGTIAEGMARHGREGRPRRTLVVLLTDGEENASSKYLVATVRAMVSRAREVFGWEFLLIGVGVDAERMARDVGILPELALPVTATAAGMRAAYLAASQVAQAALRGEEIKLIGGKR